MTGGSSSTSNIRNIPEPYKSKRKRKHRLCESIAHYVPSAKKHVPSMKSLSRHQKEIKADDCNYLPDILISVTCKKTKFKFSFSRFQTIIAGGGDVFNKCHLKMSL